MTISGDLAPLTVDLRDDLDGGPLLRRVVNHAAYTIKHDELLPVARTAGGSDRRLSNFAGGRLQMNVSYTLTNSSATIRLVKAAAWGLGVGGSVPHQVGTRTKSMLVLPQARPRPGRRRPTNVRPSPIPHPGTSGKGRIPTSFGSTVDRAVAESLATHETLD